MHNTLSHHTLDKLATIPNDVFDLEPGYHHACWYTRDLRTGVVLIDRMVPAVMRDFLNQCSQAAVDWQLDRSVGTAFLRIIDAGEPDPVMKWHRDNVDHPSTRFSTASASDGVDVNLAFPISADVVGLPTDTPNVPVRQPANNQIVMFETGPHGALCQPARPGARTAVLFTTMYRTKAEADLYQTNNLGSGEQHAILPTLEPTR